MKKILPIGLIALISFSASAVPAKKGVRSFTQADGTTISLNLVGDENFHTYITSDGLTVSKGEDGSFYYLTSNGISSIVAHNIGARNAEEAAFIKANSEDMTVTSAAKAAKNNGTIRKAPARGIRKASQVPSTGSPKVPILLVQYSDYKFKDTDPKATFTDFFTTGSVSAYQYFVDQSNGKYTPEYELYGPITLSKKRSYYGGNDSQGYDKYVGTMVGEACNLLDGQVDFSQYDNDGDGECDVVIVIYAGDGEASSYDSDAENSIWPCQWSLSSSDYGKSLTLDKTKVDKFAVFNELYGSDLTKIDGIGTFCHEFSHCLDLPDFYDTNYSGYFGMAYWSLMDTGSYNNEGYTPIGYSAYEKAFMGWIDLEEATPGTAYTLPVFNQKNIETDKAVKITNDKDANEYYILENRAQQGWDKYIPTDGMMITHVTYSASAWTGNTVNDYALQRMTIIPADNNLKMNKSTYYGETYYEVDEASLLGDLWPYGSVNELTDSSTPAAKVNTGSYMGKPVTEITKNSDGTISFNFMKEAVPSVATPTNLSHEVVSSTSAVLSWEAGDDTDVTYTVEVSKHKDVTYQLVSSTDFASNNTWTTDGSVNTKDGELYIGSSNRTGSLTSPVFTTDEDGVVTVIFSAKYYGTDKSSVKVSLLNSSNTAVDTETITLTDSYATYTVVLNGTASSSAYVKFESTANKKRVYLKSADIYTGDASEAANAAPAKAAASDKLTFTGITETTLLVSDLEENASYDFRVKAVPVDNNSYSESAWSAKDQFNLDEITSITSVAADNAVVEYFSLQGIRVNGNPSTPGIYIRRQGDKAAKVILK